MIKALFLDRDGIINIDHGYVHKIEDFEFRNGIFRLTKAFYDKGFHIFIVTNQSGIARGYYSEKTFLSLMQWVIEQFAKHGVRIEDFKFCPEILDTVPCRKPNPKMFLDLARQYNIDLSESVSIGDKDSDIIASRRANIKHIFAVKSRYNITELPQQYIFSDLHELLSFILKLLDI